MRNPFHPPPSPPDFAKGVVLPETSVSLLSRLLFSWLDPILAVGFSRPLEKNDLWTLPDNRLTRNLSESVEKAFYKRCPPEERPSSFPSQDGAPVEIAHDPLEKSPMTPVQKGDKQPKYDASLLRALNNVFFTQFWLAGILKLFSDTLNTTTPLINQILLAWLTSSYAYYRASDDQRAELGLQKPQGIGYGVGLAFAIFTMQEVSSLMSNHFQMLAMINGLCLRTSLIGAIFRKSLRLSGKARIKHGAGQITTMIAADTGRLDRNSATIHNMWVAPIQIAIGIGLLIRNLGVSAVVGLGVILIGLPIQLTLTRVMFAQRKKGVGFTDQRIRLSSEVLSGIRLIKYYAWEQFYAHQVGDLRRQEVNTIRKAATARSVLVGVVIAIPIVGTVLSIVTYALLGNTLEVAIIFSSVQYFNIIRTPLIQLPVVLAQATDALVALRRIGTFLRAQELEVPYTVDAKSDVALAVDGDFTWEAVLKGDFQPKFTAGGKAGKDEKARAKDDKKQKEQKGRSKRGEKGGAVLPVSAAPAGESEKTPLEEHDRPFELKNVSLRVPKGAFVAIVGRVGSGKSSLLQALIGEMRKTRGDCVFSSTAAYVPQSAWIMNATLRQNVIFGQPEDEEQFREIVRACCLEPDLEMLPHGELTEIGEKGINLSGGQKARVSLARAAYSGAEIVLMDDSLSAVDSHVGKKLVDGCLLNGPLAEKTRILVTHALHVLDKTDYIYVMDDGVIVEQGTYADLKANGQIFSRLMEEYGSIEKQEEEVSDLEEVAVGQTQQEKHKESKPAAPTAPKVGLMQDEERMTGAVTWTVYTRFFQFAGGFLFFPLVVFWAALSLGAQVANTLFLGFWTSFSIGGLTQADYISVYSALGLCSGLFSFALSFTISQLSLTAGLRLFRVAFTALIRSPVSFFDTTPLGRIVSRLSKDQDTVDGQLAIQALQLILTGSSVVGTIGLVFYTFPYLGIIFFPLIALYYIAALYYRRSSVEMKRLDSLLRSLLYASYSEALTGLSTVRAYRVQDRFLDKSEEGLDLENRAYYMTIAIQRWLGVRLDLLGNILILGICLFASGFRNSVDPSKIGVVLSYTLTITNQFSTMVSTYALNEQNFNAVERLLYYTQLPSEGAATTPNDPPPPWPSAGAIRFKGVEMAYRPGLPSVLKGVSFEVNPGEKIGIVGRTGAGKSSLLQALFRIVNVQEGKIEIDGTNIADIGLDVLRGRLALVPQDSILFRGTLRENLDPQNTRTDVEIIDALKRAWLLPKEGPIDPVTQAKFSLDSAVSDEGANYSAGEKQLLALCRALVKNSRIIILDEATSSVDVETDSKVQRTIQREFSSSTLLCIAHRLNTIVYYDRILVMDAGKVAEFDAPLTLFDKEDSIFRSLCNEATLSRADIVKIRAGVQIQASVPSSSSVSVAYSTEERA